MKLHITVWETIAVPVVGAGMLAALSANIQRQCKD